jgi:DNA-binding PadR family transcriptional regulator
MPRRKPGQLLALETDLLAAVAARQSVSGEGSYGYQLAGALAAGAGGRRLLGHGTLYKALARLTDQGLLESWWEELDEGGQRPRRRFYRITAAGQAARSRAAAQAAPRDGATPEATGLSPA